MQNEKTDAMMRRFLVPETELIAMTLTPPRATSALPEADSLGCSSPSPSSRQRRADERTEPNIMSKRIDYAQIAAKLDYPALDKKLEQLTQQEPPKSRKTAVDLLEPLRERLLALHRKGWSSKQLVEELKAAGVPVSPARLREALNHWTNGGKGTTKRRGNNPGKRPPAQPAPQPAASPSGRGRSVSGDNQSGLKLS